MVFGIVPPQCHLCGALIGDLEQHQRFHDAISLIWQEAFGLSDEEVQRMSGQSAADRKRIVSGLLAAAGAVRSGGASP